MILKFDINRKLNNIISFLNKNNINFLKRYNKDYKALILISDINKMVKKFINDKFKPNVILEDILADQFLDNRRYIEYKGEKLFNNESFEIIAGPCSVESKEQIDEIGTLLSALNIKYIRGGAFKPRTSPYDFQGLENKGLELLKEQSLKHNFKVITEVMDINQIELIDKYADIFQIGSRNMYNYNLLKEIGKTDKPVLLKRGMSASYEEFLLAAEYIYDEGNENIILCERGIRSFEPKTRFTLDLMSVPILKKLSDYPIIVDPSHGTGRWDLINSASKASLILGAQGVMVEVHPQPEKALSDGFQSLNFTNFKILVNEINKFRINLYEK